MTKLNLILFGYGRMGKEIEKIALQRGHDIILKVDIDNKDTVSLEDLKKGDAAIDFSFPESALNNVLKCFDADLPVVSGTTGWNHQMAEAEDICKKNGKTMFVAPNFSVGVNIFMELNRRLAGFMEAFDTYDIEMQELHHDKKLDQPSGTAIALADQITDRVTRKSSWNLDKTNNSEDVHIDCIRQGNIPGTHIIKYLSEIDDIEIKHEAHNRVGFALGAVLAAEWIKGKTGIFNMSDLLNLT